MQSRSKLASPAAPVDAVVTLIADVVVVPKMQSAFVPFRDVQVQVGADTKVPLAKFTL